MRRENRELDSKLELQRHKTSSACKTPVGAVLRFQRGIARIASNNIASMVVCEERMEPDGRVQLMVRVILFQSLQMLVVRTPPL